MKNAAGPKSFVPIQIALGGNQTHQHMYDTQDSLKEMVADIRSWRIKKGHILDCLIGRISDGTIANILIVLQEVGHLVLFHSRPTRW